MNFFWKGGMYDEQQPIISAVRDCGLLPQHDEHRLRSSCSRCSTLYAHGFVLMGKNNNNNNNNSIIFGGRLIALSKKDGGIRPISVGYTLRRLAAKCANNHAIAKRSKVLQPQQLGVGVSGRAEAAVHAARRLVSNLPSDHVIVKLDFSNAFNCIRRDLILDSIATNIPEI